MAVKPGGTVPGRDGFEASLDNQVFDHNCVQCRFPLCPAAKYSEKNKCSKTQPPVNLSSGLVWIKHHPFQRRGVLPHHAR